jgi:hypothetical protein
MDMLHDMGQAMETLHDFINDFRQPNEPVINAPFTDAHVTYYEANGVSN